ncbi:craniofacial development protein 1 isoform X1 [Populus alba x Populus x berolinensis]|nr:craniofacial development protein 1 isoform X1 [Populus alba x Populus x berolinensis]
MMGSQVESVKEIVSDRKPERGEMESRVEAIWEKMNKGVSNKTAKSFSNKRNVSTVNASSKKANNNWMAYLGLTPKEADSSGQDGEVQQNGTSVEDSKVASLWEHMNKGVPNKLHKTFLNKSCSTVDESSQPKSDNWMTYLGMATKRKEYSGHDEPQRRADDIQNGSGDEARKLAAAALSAVKDAAAAAAAAAAGRGKVEIREVRDFAGQEIEVRKLVDADSKEATEKAKAPAPSAVDAVLEQIKKKPKLSVLDKTKKDWGEYKEENKGLEDELDAYKKSSNQYLERVSFLERTDYREFERERDARLALQARRRTDMREDL